MGKEIDCDDGTKKEQFKKRLYMVLSLKRLPKTGPQCPFLSSF